MNILMINQGQFGYNAGYYHYCKHLSAQGHRIVYLCNDYHLKKMELDLVTPIYVDEPNSVKWRLEFCKRLEQIMQEYSFDVILCSYFKCCSMLTKYFGTTPSIMDIRSGDVNKNALKRSFFNWLIKKEANKFSRTMILSESLSKKLKLKSGSFDIIPLGADVICENQKEYDDLRLFYVGTLKQRDIDKTIEGLILFNKKYPEVDFHYDIVGFGMQHEEDKIKSLIKENQLEGKVVFHGRINYEDLKPFFMQANLGVAYVPMTPYYECQPSTKIYEYVLSGMYCIATNTYENRILIEPVNGLICDDNAESFCEALVQYHKMDRSGFNSAEIRKSMEKYEWSNIVNNQLFAIMQKLVADKC